MPVAVVTGDAERFELKSLPGGYVTIRVMTWGEKMERRKFNSKMEMQLRRGSNDARTFIDAVNEQAELYDFSHCIVDHNLQDVDERKLDLKNPTDVRKLHGRVAEEIGTYIDKVNNFEESDEGKASANGSAHTS